MICISIICEIEGFLELFIRKKEAKSDKYQQQVLLEKTTFSLLSVLNYGSSIFLNNESEILT